MNRYATSTLLAIVLVLSLGTIAFAAGSKKARLGAGEIILNTQKVPGSEQPRATVMAVVDAPASKIWGILSKCSDYKRTMVRVVESKELWVKGKVHRCKVTIDLPFPLSTLTAVTDAVHTVIPGKKWERKWTLVEGDYEKNSGSWTLAPFTADGSRTLVVYKVHAIPNLPIPDGIRRAAQRKTLPNIMKNLRAQVAR